jgi:hypothetical protein
MSLTSSNEGAKRSSWVRTRADPQLLVDFSKYDSSHFYARATPRPHPRSGPLSCRSSLLSNCLRPIMVRAEAWTARTIKTRTAVFGSPDCGKMPPAKRHRKNRGMPPPATFDIDTLPGSSNLTALEAAAVIRRTPGALEQWRRDPNHPLKWRYVDGRPLYRVDAVRDYLAGRVSRRPTPRCSHEPLRMPSCG